MLLFLEQVSDKEEDIRGALGQSPHEIRIPLTAKGDVHPDIVSLPRQLLLEIAPDAIDHLKFEGIFREYFFNWANSFATRIMVVSCVAIAGQVPVFYLLIVH